jgi:hypothetical protein
MKKKFENIKKKVEKDGYIFSILPSYLYVYLYNFYPGDIYCTIKYGESCLKFGKYLIFAGAEEDEFPDKLVENQNEIARMV